MTISDLALAAKKVIDAAWLHGDAYDLSSQAAFALESAQLLQSPHTADELDVLRRSVETNRVDGQRLIRAEQRCAELEAAIATHRKDDRAQIERLRARVTELAEGPTVAFLASRDSRTLGMYRQSEDALHHCEDAFGRTAGYSAGTPFSWREHPDGTRELFAWTSREVSSATGFTVARLELRAEFDEGWGADADVEIEPEVPHAAPCRWPSSPDCACKQVEESADKLTRLLAPTQALREDDDPGRCLKVHAFGPRDGWRMICSSCDHSKDAECHRVGAGDHAC